MVTGIISSPMSSKLPSHFAGLEAQSLFFKQRKHDVDFVGVGVLVGMAAVGEVVISKLVDVDGVIVELRETIIV